MICYSDTISSSNHAVKCLIIVKQLTFQSYKTGSEKVSKEQALRFGRSSLYYHMQAVQNGHYSPVLINHLPKINCMLRLLMPKLGQQYPVASHENYVRSDL